MEDFFIIFGAISFALSSILFVLILGCYLAAPSPYSNQQRLDDLNARFNILEEGNEANLRDLRGVVNTVRLRHEQLDVRLGLLPTQETINNLEKQIAQTYGVLVRDRGHGSLPLSPVEGPKDGSEASSQPLYTPLTQSVSLTSSLQGISGHPPVSLLPPTSIDSFCTRLRALQQLSAEAKASSETACRFGPSRDRSIRGCLLRGDAGSGASSAGEPTPRVALVDSKLNSAAKLPMTRL